MKIIHCADIHADSKLSSHFSKEKADERRSEIIDTFDNMVSYARDNGVRVIMIAGDLFDTKVSQNVLIKKRIAYIIKENKEIDFLYLRGNHDEDVEFAGMEDMPNLKTFSKSEWKKYSYDNVDIYGYEFGQSIPAKFYDDIINNRVISDPKKVNIILLHGQVVEYKAKDGAPVISLDNFIDRNIDYIALGHIHDYKSAKLDRRGTWCYSGCLEGRGFDECGDKGFVLLDIEKNTVNTKFISFPKRKINEVEVRLDGQMDYNEIMDAIKEGLSSIPESDIVQVLLTGEVTEDTDIETDAYQKQLSNKYYYIRFIDRTEHKIDYEKYKDDVSLKGEFIRLVKGQDNLTDSEKEEVILTGIRALAGRIKNK